MLYAKYGMQQSRLFEESDDEQAEKQMKFKVVSSRQHQPSKWNKRKYLSRELSATRHLTFWNGE